MSQHDRENTLVLSLVQAMVGAISPNFRRVSLGLVDDVVQLQFVLEHDSEEDREEVSDIEFEFEALQASAVEVVVAIIVSAEPLSGIAAAGRVVYARRES